jgi:hypothetical protein
MPNEETTAAMTADTARIDIARKNPLRRHTELILSGPDPVAAVLFDITGNWVSKPCSLSARWLHDKFLD